MRSILSKKYWWLWLVVILAGINFLAARIHQRFDLTSEKRYSLSKATKNLLRNLDDEVEVEVFLKGQFPAGFKRLANTTREFLYECREYSGGKLNVVFTNPFEGLSDSASSYLLDSMNYYYDLGTFVVGNPQIKAGEEVKQREVLPGAVVRYKNRTAVVNLLRGAKATGTAEEELAELYNRVETALEFKFADAIQKVTATSKPLIGYALGHGEPWGPVVDDAVRTIAGKNPYDTASSYYRFDTVNLATAPYIPDAFNALLLVKPARPFNETEKLKLDQYLVRGGKIFLMADVLFAEFDSLLRSPNQTFTAFDRGLNIDDLLFKYGVRINRNLLQDLQCDRLPQMYGGQGQQTVLDFPFFPLLNGTSHPISKNLDVVRTIFPNTIDTVAAPGIQKNILLTSSANARLKGTPAVIDLEFMKYAPDPQYFKQKELPVAVLLEGKFTSFFNNRLTKELQDTLAASGQTFTGTAAKEGKLVVVADGDLATNFMSPQRGPLPMGVTALNVFNPSASFQFANKDFFLNSIEYLVNNTGIPATRAKNF
ncbi:MAG: Gldg family protein, partial [Dinghuibacter sp.]|nr:Gldg family protein [Dinghuibacter sp.]